MSSNQLLDPTNILVLPANVLGNFRYADWQGAAARGGIAGIAAEGLQATSGANTEPFFVPCDSEWKIQDIRRSSCATASSCGASATGITSSSSRVKGRQAHWAQYVLLRAGVPLLHGMLDGSRAIPGCGATGRARVARPRWRVRCRARLDRESAWPVMQLPVL